MRYLLPLLLAGGCAALIAACGDDGGKIAPEDDSTPALTQPWPEQTEPAKEIPVKEAPAPGSAEPVIKPASPDEPLAPEEGDENEATADDTR